MKNILTYLRLWLPMFLLFYFELKRNVIGHSLPDFLQQEIERLPLLDLSAV